MFTIRNLSVIMLSMIMFLPGCDSKSPVQSKNEIKVIGSRVSDCGGFEETSKRSDVSIPFTRNLSTYCDAEKLEWFYENSTHTLKLLNSRVFLNCCGEHEITAHNENGIIVVSENDQPVEGTGRCWCMCVYDFYIDISGLESGVIKMMLDITVDDTKTSKWEGEIDLRKENGEIVIDDNPLEYGCP